MRFLTLLTFVICMPVFSNAQSITFKKFFDFGLDLTFNVLEDTDGYITVSVAGHPVVPMNYCFIKTDKQGDTILTKHYGDSLEFYEISGLIKTYDGNYLSGSRVSSYTNLKAVFIVKFSPAGDTLWTRKFYAPPGYFYNGLFFTECTDHGFLITGQIVDTLVTIGDGFILKTDSVGNFLWTSTFGGIKFDCASSSIELPDKGFLTLGWSRSLSFGDRDMYLVKTDSIGNIKWQKHYGTTYLDGGIGISKTSDGNYLLAGYKGTPSLQGIDGWLLKIDTAGIILWQNTLTQNFYDSELWCARELADGSIITAGMKNEFTFTKDSAWICKVSSQGIKLWDRSFGSYNDHSCFRDVIQTSDGGYICAGFVFKGPTGNQDAWLIKLDSLGCDSFGCPTVYSGVGLNELTNEAEFSVYPNPVKDVLTIHFSYSLFSACNIKIYNMLGSEVYSSRTFIQRQTAIPVNELPAGVYLLSLKYEGQMVTRKFIKN